MMRGLVIALGATICAFGLLMVDPWLLFAAAGALIVNEAL